MTAEWERKQGGDEGLGKTGENPLLDVLSQGLHTAASEESTALSLDDENSVVGKTYETSTEYITYQLVVLSPTKAVLRSFFEPGWTISEASKPDAADKIGQIIEQAIADGFSSYVAGGIVDTIVLMNEKVFNRNEHQNILPAANSFVARTEMKANGSFFLIQVSSLYEGLATVIATFTDSKRFMTITNRGGRLSAQELAASLEKLMVLPGFEAAIKEIWEKNNKGKIRLQTKNIRLYIEDLENKLGVKTLT